MHNLVISLSLKILLSKFLLHRALGRLEFVSTEMHQLFKANSVSIRDHALQI